MNMWILLQMSVISFPLQRWSLQGFVPGWGVQVWSKGCAKGFQPRSPAEVIAPQSFRERMHICKSQELKSLCGSLLALPSKLENCQLPVAGPCPQKDMVSWLLGCGGQKYRGFRRELAHLHSPAPYKFQGKQ